MFRDTPRSHSEFLQPYALLGPHGCASLPDLGDGWCSLHRRALPIPCSCRRGQLYHNELNSSSLSGGRNFTHKLVNPVYNTRPESA